MDLWPGLQVVKTVGATPQTLVSTPDAGTSRLVTTVTLFNNDFVQRDFRLYLNDGSHEYSLYNQPIDLVSSQILPLVYTAAPIILENGWTLEVVSDAKTFLEIDLTASYGDDVGTVEEVSPYHVAGFENDGVNWGTVVSEPDEGLVRTVRMVSLSNDDEVTHNYFYRLYDIDNTIGYNITVGLTVASTIASMLLITGKPIVVPHGWRLEAQCGIAEDTRPSHFTAHYLDSNEHDGAKP